MTGFADTKRQMRRDVHAAFAVGATYEDAVVVVPMVLAVRWHDKAVPPVTAMNELTDRYQYIGVVENIDQLVFDAEELTEKGIALVRNGLVKLTEFHDYELVLDMKLPADGPFKIIWSVKRPSQTADL